MAYIPGSARNSSKSEGYVPSSERKFLLSPDLQALVDEAAKKLEVEEHEQVKESTATSQPEETLEKSLNIDERWAYLRSERNKRLAQTDYVNDSGRSISFEERGKLYRFRQELRDLPSLEGAPWTPKTIPWPTSPLGEGSH